MSASVAVPGLRLRSAARSHAGAKRLVNEDRVLDRPEIGLWVIADGMGGHHAGAAAAVRVIDACAALDGSGSGYCRLADAERALQAVNAELFGGHQGTSVSGATLVLLLVHEDHFACLWAGDSRAYLWRDKALQPISRDHSLVQSLVDAGQLAESERRLHPQANVVTRAVGAHETLELDRRFAAIRPGDIFLLCSDGLTACFDDRELEARLDADLDTVADALLETALAREAADNVSLIMIQAVADQL